MKKRFRRCVVEYGGSVDEKRVEAEYMEVSDSASWPRVLETKVTGFAELGIEHAEKLKPEEAVDFLTRANKIAQTTISVTNNVQKRREEVIRAFLNYICTGYSTMLRAQTQSYEHYLNTRLEDA